MAPDRITALFFELFSGLPRQGPGSAADTRRALGLVPETGRRTRILDIGCGTGAQTLVLAASSPARIVAIDTHPPFIDALNREARRLGIEDRLQARVADMRSLDFADGSFDLIWCEGAIYNVGIERGLRDWRRLLSRSGHVALTEVCWRNPRHLPNAWRSGTGSIRRSAAPPPSWKPSRRAVTQSWGTFRSPPRRGGTTTIGRCSRTSAYSVRVIAMHRMHRHWRINVSTR